MILYYLCFQQIKYLKQSFQDYLKYSPTRYSITSFYFHNLFVLLYRKRTLAIFHLTVQKIQRCRNIMLCLSQSALLMKPRLLGQRLSIVPGTSPLIKSWSLLLFHIFHLFRRSSRNPDRPMQRNPKTSLTLLKVMFSHYY